jgi:hypothetical protein
MFRTLGFGAKKSHMLDSAVSAAFAFEQKGFNWVFKRLHQKPAGGPATKPTSNGGNL